MKVIWKGDEGNAGHVLFWEGVHFVPGKVTDVPANFAGMAALRKNALFEIVGDEPPASNAPMPHTLITSNDPRAPHPASLAAKTDKR